MESYVAGRWCSMEDEGKPLLDATTGAVVAHVSTQPVPATEALAYARVHGAALRELSFHERAGLLKQLGAYLMERKDELYDVSYALSLIHI